MENKTLAQLVMRCINELSEKDNFEPFSDEWYELKLAFMFEMKDGKITKLNINSPKIVKAKTREKS